MKIYRIPFSRASELAEKFKILDVLFPLFVDEPSIYLSSSMSATHNNNEVIPSPPATNKCNLSSPLPGFRSAPVNDEYSNTTTTSNWEPRPYTNHYDHGNKKKKTNIIYLFICLLFWLND